MKLTCLFLVALALVPVSAEAQRGRAFLNEPLNTAEEYAKRIETCRTREEMKKGERSPFLNLSCEALVESFNSLDGIEDVDNHRELADYVRTLLVQPCPVLSDGRASIARVIRDEVDFFERSFRDGERCLVDLSLNRYISSMVCGQWIRTEYPYTFTRLVEEEAPPPERPPTTIRESVDKAARETKLRETRTDVDIDRGRSWFGRNWGWLMPVAAAAAIGAVCAFVVDNHCMPNDDVRVCQVVGLPAGYMVTDDCEVRPR